MNYEDATSEVIIESLEKIKKLEQVIDMQQAIIEGMRGVIGVARMIKSDDVRLAVVLKKYDQCKLP